MRNFYKISVGGAIAIALFARSLFAQAGNDNPTGTSGEFNGEVTTAGSYDPYTTSTTRSSMDLLIAAGVGAYPLAFTRTTNSRYVAGLSTELGPAGSWRHSYQWSIDGYTNSRPGTPMSYYVNYPDGRQVYFNATSRNANSNPYFLAGAGVRERLQVTWDNPSSPSTGTVYLILSDGGKVWFSAAAHQQTYSSGTYTTFTYTFQGIIDPYGQITTITHPSDGSTVVTEPAGRWIKLSYKTITSASQGALNDRVIDYITASDGRKVQYSYTAFKTLNNTIYTTLTGVTYFNDSTLTANYTYQADNIDATGRPLLSSCSDPMYGGSMWKIAYKYATANNPDGTKPVYGQILSENNPTTGQAVSTLTINGLSRTETRGDTRTRGFTYSAALLSNYSDFKGISMPSPLGYDPNSYVKTVTDRNGHTTSFTNDPLTGVLTSVTYPTTSGVTGSVSYTYGSATCPDPNNRGNNPNDPNDHPNNNNPYYLYSVTDEGGHTTTYTRDTNKRVTRVDYPDGGYETFTYNSFGQVLTHLMKTGGKESFTYDGRGLKQTYRDPDHDPDHATGNPTAWYQYDSLDRVSGVTDTLGSAAGDINHTANSTYNSRGQVLVTTLPVDPIDGQRHTISNVYNPVDGTLTSVTDVLGHVTSYTYDDYRRPRSATTPGHNTPQTAYTFYDRGGTGEDYTLTDSNVTHAVSPGGEKITTTYDENLRKTSVTVADGTSEAAQTSYGYDNVGNLTSVISPMEQPGQQCYGRCGSRTVTAYDERNRLMSVTDTLGHVTSCIYDAAGRKAKATRPNGQIITYDTYDVMNRLLKQTVKQTPDPDAVTNYTYYTSGLLHTMQDPRSNIYSYNYDLMGRKTSVTYPPDSGNQRSESWHYDTAGRNDTFTNRAGNVQTFAYDTLNRLTGFSWNDGGVTPSVTVGHDVASRITSIVNANATISHTYFNDNLLNTETTTYVDITYVDNIARTVTYTYNADGNRATIQYPNGAYSFTYNYTARNQLRTLVNNAGNTMVANYFYDLDGNLTERALENRTSTTYNYDVLDRVTHISHDLTADTRTLDYGYDSVSNRKWTKRDTGTGDVFGYDLNDQTTATLLNVANPDTTSPGSQTINYDANGNRTTFSAYGPTDTYTTNNLNQYTARNSSQASYDNDANMTTGLDGSRYSYDAQNRLLSATKSGSTESFKYDGLNRQVSRKIGAASPLYNVYDGWDLIAEYQPRATTPLNAYLNGAGGLVKLMTASSSFYYYQDASGCTSHLADSNGQLAEWYRYDLQGTPIFYNSSNSQLPSSNYGIRHLFTGQQWYSEIGLYDLRNRFYSPDAGRFLQADPVDFNGDPTNLYRYCGNNPLKNADPLGLWTFQVGVSFNVRIGAFAGNFTGGIAVDGYGNVGAFKTYFGGMGAGGQASGGVSIAGSTADTISGLGGPYYNVNGGAGLGPSGSAQGFWGNDPTNGQRVYGGGVTIGAGVGGGGSGGGSYTTIYPLWSPSSSNSSPPPPNPDAVDCGPNCATYEPVTVTGTVPNSSSGSATPSTSDAGTNWWNNAPTPSGAAIAAAQAMRMTMADALSMGGHAQPMFGLIGDGSEKNLTDAQQARVDMYFHSLGQQMSNYERYLRYGLSFDPHYHPYGGKKPGQF